MVYYRVGYRKYRGERKLAEITKLQVFLREVMGKKYKFDPMYLIGDSKKDDTYFCSELVAAALQSTSLMYENRRPFKYLPSKFEDM